MKKFFWRPTVVMLRKSKKQLPSSKEVRTSAEERYRNKNSPDILYKSENFVVLNKGYDIKTNSDDPDEMTVEQQLRELYPQHVDDKLSHGFRFPHRLDFATSGVLCVSLNKAANSWISKEFQLKRVTKHYLALVRGHIQDDLIYINVPTGRLNDPANPTWYRFCTLNDPRCIKVTPTQTLVICLEKGQIAGEPATKVLMKPFTGRTHQLRVHTHFLGHPIVGDFTYSDRQDTAPERMMLHAYKFNVSMKKDLIDVTTADPFTHEAVTNWTPSDMVRSYEEGKDIADKFEPINFSDFIKDGLKVYEYDVNTVS